MIMMYLRPWRHLTRYRLPACILLISSIVTLGACPVSAFDKETRQEEAINSAEIAGRKLGERMQRRDTVQPAELDNYTELERFIEARGCPGYRYQPYRVKFAGGDYLYMMGINSNDVIIGRHFRLPIRGGNVDTSLAMDSTTTCLNLGKPSRNQPIRVIHQGDYPNEFHVAQTVAHNTAIEVHTRNGKYLINRGHIAPR